MPFKGCLFYKKINKNHQKRKKVKKVVDKGEKIWYYNQAPLRKGSEERTLKIKQRLTKKDPTIQVEKKLGKTEKNKR